MPIPVEQLKKSTQPLSERVLEFLRRDPSQAFTAVEIYGGIENLSDSAIAVFALVLLGSGKDGRMSELREVLHSLERDGRVQSARHHNVVYYAIKQS